MAGEIFDNSNAFKSVDNHKNYQGAIDMVSQSRNRTLAPSVSQHEMPSGKLNFYVSNLNLILN